MLGSPLGMKRVFPHLESGPAQNQGRRPPDARRWVNVADPGDPVPIPPKPGPLSPAIDLDLDLAAG
jgi:hypothetical protein